MAILDLHMGTLMAILLHTWHFRVKVRTVWQGVSKLWVDGTASLICNFHLSVAAQTAVQADSLWDMLCMLLGRYAPRR